VEVIVETTAPPDQCRLLFTAMVPAPVMSVGTSFVTFAVEAQDVERIVRALRRWNYAVNLRGSR